MNTLRDQYESRLQKAGATPIVPSPVTRFHCWMVADQAPFTAYDWKGNVVDSGFKINPVYVWLGAHGAVYTTRTPRINQHRPKSTIRVARIDAILYNPTKGTKSCPTLSLNIMTQLSR